jgi:2-haloacid dehalogenase/putative hydrolase of the HAD superfamily
MEWPRALLLDFYGTVVEEADELISDTCEEVAGAAASAPAPQEIASYWGRRFYELCHVSNGPRFQSERDIELHSIQDVLRRFHADMEAKALCDRLFERSRQPPAFPEAGAVLASLTVPVCLVSNVDNAELRAALDHNHLSFERIVTSEDCRAYKPHPAPFLRALALMGLRAQDVLHVGDGLTTDVQGAQALDIPVAWVNRTGRALRPGMKQPDFVVSDLWGVLSAVGVAR